MENFKSCPFMNQQQAAEYLGTTVGTLNTWRNTGKNKIPYFKWGRCIRYRKEDLDAFVMANMHATDQQTITQ